MMTEWNSEFVFACKLQFIHNKGSVLYIYKWGKKNTKRHKILSNTDSADLINIALHVKYLCY